MTDRKLHATSVALRFATPLMVGVAIGAVYFHAPARTCPSPLWARLLAYVAEGVTIVLLLGVIVLLLVGLRRSRRAP